MKRLSTVLLFGLMLLHFAFAQSCGVEDDDQLIFRISSQTNAHSEEWNGAGNYPEEICYNTIFGIRYVGANPHLCIASNIVLKASAPTNAHVEQADQANYPIEIGYGDLTCTYADTSIGEDCDADAGEECIVTISTPTNAHVSSICTGAGSYDIKVCCSSTAAAPEPPRFQIVSFELQPNVSIMEDSGREQVNAVAKVENNGGDADARVEITVESLKGVTKAGPLNATKFVPGDSIMQFDETDGLFFEVDGTWEMGNYKVYANVYDKEDTLYDQVMRVLTVAVKRTPVPEISLLLLPLIAFSILAIIFFSRKKQEN